MSLQACADLVLRGDPDRFAAAMAASPEARRVLFPLYAFNLEVARAPWVTQEPLIAEMRLQWWRDALDEIATGAPVRRHEVATPLSEILDPDGARLLDALVEARRWDIHGEGLNSTETLLTHLDATSGHLFWVAARALGAPPDCEPVARDAGLATGLAGWFRAVPDYAARGRRPLPDPRPGAIETLAHQGLRRLARARAGRHALPASARPALFPAALAGPLLRKAARAPDTVAQTPPSLSQTRSRALLLWVALTGRW